MKKILFTNQFEAIEKFLNYPGAENTAYVALEPLKNHRWAGRNLTKDIFTQRSSFKAEFLQFIKKVNLQNSSLEWWAMNFTDKNPLITDLYTNMFFVSGLVEVIKKAEFRLLIVFTSNRSVAKKIKSQEAGLKVRVSYKIKTRFDIRTLLRDISPLMIFYAAIKGFIRNIFSLYSNKVITRGCSLGKPYLIVTHFEDTSFKNGAFNDPYFRSLKDFLSQRGKDVFIAGIVSCKLKNVLFNKETNIFSLDRFIGIFDICRCLFMNILLFFSKPYLNNAVSIFGIDFKDLVNKEIKASIHSGQAFFNMSIYFAGLSLFRWLHPTKIFYPFENRSWEKMVVLAARSVCKDARLIGYQHAALTDRHVNFYLEKGEYEKTPLPDEIITMGYVSKDIMSDMFNFPRERLKVGCALRHSFGNLPTAAIYQPGSIKNILVVLASSMKEYVNMLIFLDNAFIDSQPYNLIIRPHPVIDFRRALRLYLPQHIRYELDSRPLSESLMSCDMIIYASSTVSLEAISVGKPVIFVQFDDILGTDPLFDFSSLKWTCREPSELKAIIEQISKIDKTDFSILQEEARKFSQLYCVPATANSLEVFI